MEETDVGQVETCLNWSPNFLSKHEFKVFHITNSILRMTGKQTVVKFPTMIITPTFKRGEEGGNINFFNKKKGRQGLSRFLTFADRGGGRLLTHYFG